MAILSPIITPFPIAKLYTVVTIIASDLSIEQNVLEE